MKKEKVTNYKKRSFLQRALNKIFKNDPALAGDVPNIAVPEIEPEPGLMGEPPVPNGLPVVVPDKEDDGEEIIELGGDVCAPVEPEEEEIVRLEGDVCIERDEKN